MREHISETRFDSGLVVLTDRMAGVRSATLGFFYRVGSRHEPAALNGITHFIEHSVFKGTERRSAKEIAVEQDRLGGNLDAFTTHEETGFAIKVIDEQLPAAFDLLADMLANPRFDETDLESEQRVIIEEMKMMEDSPDELLSDIFHRECFPGHPLGLSITGIPATVKTFDGKTTRSYHASAFRPSNLVITAAGNVDHDRIVELVTAAGLDQASGSNGSKETEKAPEIAAPIILTNKPELEQVHVVIATPFPNARSEKRYAADLLANIIGGGTSSRLWQKVREERGLAYSVGSAALPFLDCGLFSISAGTSPEQFEELLDIVVDEMRWIVRNGIDSDELQLMKDQAQASILMGLEDSASRAATLANMEMVHGRQIALEETLANLESVTEEAVTELAREYFRTENIAIAALGDLKGQNISRDRVSI